MATKTLISLEQFASLPDDGMLHDLDEGELVLMSRPSHRHGKLQGRICARLLVFVEQNRLGDVTTESGYILSQEPDTVRGPDVAFISAAKLNSKHEHGWPVAAPDLAVEIVSPSDTALEVERKVRQYLQAGTNSVWVVYPEAEAVYVYQKDRSIRRVAGDEMLEAPEILPGFTLKVNEIFQSA